MIPELSKYILRDTQFLDKLLIVPREVPRYMQYTRLLRCAMQSNDTQFIKWVVPRMGFKTPCIFQLGYMLKSIKYAIYGMVIMKIGFALDIHSVKEAIEVCKELLKDIITKIFNYNHYYINRDLFDTENGKILRHVISGIIRYPNEQMTRLFFCEILPRALDNAYYRRWRNVEMIKEWCEQENYDDFMERMKSEKEKRAERELEEQFGDFSGYINKLSFDK